MRRRVGIERESASRADQRVLRWVGQVEKMDEYRMAGRVRGRPRLGEMDGMKMDLISIEMTAKAGRQCAKDRRSGEPWYM